MMGCISRLGSDEEMERCKRREPTGRERHPAETATHAADFALIGKRLFHGIVALIGIIAVSGYRIDFQPGNRHQLKVVCEKGGDQQDECQKKYFNHFIHLVPLQPLRAFQSDAGPFDTRFCRTAGRTNQLAGNNCLPASLPGQPEFRLCFIQQVRI